MSEILAFLVVHWPLWIGPLVVAVVSAIVGMTKTPTDDTIWHWILQFMARLGLTTWKDAPGSVKLPGQTAGETPIFIRRDGDRTIARLDRR